MNNNIITILSYISTIILIPFHICLCSLNNLPQDSAFFPIAVWLQSPSNAGAYQEAGINLFVGLWEGPTQSQLDQLLSAGMQVICDQNGFALANLDTYGEIIAGWMHGDEPDNAQWNGSSYDPCIEPDTIIARYNLWKGNDPERPVYLNLGQGVSYTDWVGRGTCTGRTDMYPLYCQGCDIVSYDIYPVNSDYETVEGNLWYVAKGVDSLIVWSGGEKPVWCWIECTAIDADKKPTPSQVRSEVWMALIHGAKGFGYFCHSWYPSFREAAWLSDDPGMTDTITAVNARIASLAPVLNSADIPSMTLVSSSNAGVPIDVMTKIHGEYAYVFAAAMRDDTTTGIFTVDGLPGAATAEVLDEERTLEVNGQQFSDRFEGYEVHIYKIHMPTGAENYSRLSSCFEAKDFSGTVCRLAGTSAATVANNLHKGTRLGIYSSKGELICELTVKNSNAKVLWDGMDCRGRAAAKGVYIVKTITTLPKQN